MGRKINFHMEQVMNSLNAQQVPRTKSVSCGEKSIY